MKRYLRTICVALTSSMADTGAQLRQRKNSPRKTIIWQREGKRGRERERERVREGEC